MSARIFIHPICLSDMEAGHKLFRTLQDAGYDTAKVLMGPPDYRRRVELVRQVSLNVDGSTTYERMNGQQFIHGTGRPL